MWRPDEISYDALAQHLSDTQDFPTYLPSPMGAGWQVTDLAVVRDGARTLATLAGVAATTADDGPVEILVVSEEPGTGLGARVSGTLHDDPGGLWNEGRGATRIRVDTADHHLWAVDHSLEEHDRSILVGEVGGRWLWLVVRPASAVLLLVDGWSLADMSDVGPALLDLSFGGPPPVW